MTRGRFRLPAAVVLLLAAVYLLAWDTLPTGGTHATSATSPAQTAPVTAVSRVCPPPAPGTGQARVALVAADPRAGTSAGTPGTAKSGTAKLLAVPAGAPDNAKSGQNGTAATVTAPVTAPNDLSVLTAPQPAAQGATELTAVGSLGAGFEAEQSNGSGLGGVACGHAGSDYWFAAAGGSGGAKSSWLYLTNPGDMAAAVDLSFLTDGGPQSNPEITVAPHSYARVNLAAAARGSLVLAVHVETSSGQVAAAMWESGGSGGAWVPAAAQPATRLVIPGLTSAGRAVKLYVAVPGGKDAQLRVTGLTAGGKFRPLGQSATDVPASSASTYPLSALGSSASTLVLTSDVPVTAGVLVPGNGIGGFTAAGQPVTGQGVVAGNPVGGGNKVSLVLSAPSAAARAAISVIPGHTGAAVAPSSALAVPAGRTVQVTVGPPKGAKGPFAIVVTPLPGSGPLYAVRAVTAKSGALVSLLPVPSAPTAVQLPPAAEGYRAVTP